MELIMAAKLTVRKELLDQLVHYQHNGWSHSVPLADATQEQLAVLKELGMDIFEKEAKAEKEK
jgi:hypothetical protein